MPVERSRVVAGLPGPVERARVQAARRAGEAIPLEPVERSAPGEVGWRRMGSGVPLGLRDLERSHHGCGLC